jgi:hypothetical protein
MPLDFIVLKLYIYVNKLTTRCFFEHNLCISGVVYL